MRRTTSKTMTTWAWAAVGMVLLASAWLPALALGGRSSVASVSETVTASAGALRPIGAAKRSIAFSVEGTWSVPASQTVRAALEYSFLEEGAWRVPVIGSLDTSATADGSGVSAARLTLRLAGTWRIRQVLTWDSGSCVSQWATVRVAAHRPKGRVKVVVYGDSLAGMPGIALRRMLKGTAASVVLDYKSSSGISRPDFFDWAARMAAQRRRIHPDIVVIYMGANDWQNMRSGGHIYTRGSRAWDALYARRAARLMDIARSEGATVYVIGQTITGRTRGYARHMAHLNAIVKPVARRRANVRFVTTWSLFATPGGAYSSRLRTSSGALVNMRSRDCIHFSGAGASRMAGRIRHRVESDWGHF